MISDQFDPLVSYGEDATAYVRLGNMGQNFSGIPENEWPVFNISGFAFVATRIWGNGKIIVAGDGQTVSRSATTMNRVFQSTTGAVVFLTSQLTDRHIRLSA